MAVGIPATEMDEDTNERALAAKVGHMESGASTVSGTAIKVSFARLMWARQEEDPNDFKRDVKHRLAAEANVGLVNAMEDPQICCPKMGGVVCQD